MARINFRQGIVRHQTDGANNPVFLQQVGDNVNLLVSPDFTTLNFIHGDKDYLYTESVTVSAAWNIPAGPDYWLYFDLDKVSGIRTFGQTTLEPVTAATAPVSPAAGQMWFNTAQNMWYEHNGSAFVEKIRVFAAKSVAGTTFISMSANSPLYTGTQIGNTSTVNVGSLAFDSTGSPIVNQTGKFFTTEDVFTAGVPTGASLKVNNILVRAVAQAPLAAYNVVQFSDFDKINIANPFDAIDSVFGIVDTAVSTGDVANVITEGVIFNAAWDWEGAGAVINDPLYIDATGQLVLATAIPNQIPVAAVIGKQEILFKLGIYGFVATTEHSALGGLAVDDHVQYALADGTRGTFATVAQGALADSALQVITGEAIGSLSDVTDTTPANRDVFVHNGAGAYVNRPLVEADISDLQAYILAAGVTYGQLDTNGDVGTSAGQLAIGNHTHLEADVTDLRFRDLGEFIIASLPAAASNANSYALATDASGGRTIVRSDGTNWKIVVVEGATVS